MNSEIVSVFVKSIESKQGMSKNDREYRLNIISGIVAEDSGFKSSLPVVFSHFLNKGETNPNYKVGDKIKIGIDSLEIDKRSIRITKGVIV